MSRLVLAAAVVLTTSACADSDTPTSPRTITRHLSSGVPPCSAARGQQLIDAGQYPKAVKEFTCVIALDPTAVDGYRGRIEAELILGKFSDAARDHARITAFVLPVHPDAPETIIAGYEARLAVTPNAVTALSGLSFAHWWFFQYAAALRVLDRLLEVAPNDLYGTLLRGSTRLLHGASRAAGVVDLDRAIALAPTSPDVRFIVADAYTYGWLPDPQRAFNEATFALLGGLDTPRIHAILATSYLAFGDMAAAAAEFTIHFDLVTTELVSTSPLAAGASKSLPLVAGRTYDIPVSVTAGETLSISTGSKDFFDTILVLLAPNGTPIVANDDSQKYFAGLEWVAPATGTYRLRVTSFEGVSSGTLVVARN